MNQRQQLEQTLPPATQQMLAKCYNLIQNAGLKINPDDFSLVVRAVVGYLTSTKEGRLDSLMFLNASVQKGSYLKQYFARHGMGGKGQKISADKIFEYRGFIVDGTGVKDEQVIVENTPDLIECQVTNVRLPAGYCVVTVKDPKTGKELTASNHARLHHEQDYVKSTATFKTCADCRYAGCAFNPNNQPVMAPPKQLTYINSTPQVGEYRMIK